MAWSPQSAKLLVADRASRRRAAMFVLLSAVAFTVVAARDVTSSNPYFHPHGYCYLWEPGLVWTHVGADLLIGGAYMTIPIALLAIVRRAGGGVPFSGMLVAFGTFIVACGLTHFVEVVTLWQPWFWAAAAFKVVTAIASVATAFAVRPLVPKVLTMIDSANLAEERRLALEAAHAELETRVQTRTRELTETVARLEREVAARVAVEQQLRMRDAQLRGIMDHSPSYIYLKDHDCRFIVVNRRLAEVYGSSDRLIGKSNAELFPPALAAQYDANDRRALAGETVQAIEDEETPQGRQTYLSAKFPITDAAGAVIAMGGISTDVTERERLREEREHLLAREQELRRQAEENVRAKDAFLAAVSHELRTPLNAIMGYVHMLRVGTLPLDGEGRAVATIDRNARALRRLVEDLLTVSGLVTGRLRLELERVDVGRVLRIASESIQMEAAEQAVSIEVAVNSEPLQVAGDELRLLQVFTNVIGNAVKFSSQGGVVRVDAQASGGDVRIRVVDQGVGMTEEFLAHAFEPFRQAEAGTTRGTTGLGLGLAIARRLVEAHGGTVSAESAGPGAGSTFTIWLPADGGGIQR